MSAGTLFRLEYQLVTDGWELDFDAPVDLDWCPGPFDLHLSHGLAIVELNDRFVSEAEARQIVESYLRSWEIDTNLRLSESAFMRFEFLRGSKSDRDTSAELPAGGVRVSQCVVEVMLSKPPRKETYPPPPQNFLADSDIEVLWMRYQDYRQHRASLAACAYFCSTLLENRFRGVAGAAQQIRMSRNVLDKLAELASKRGSPLSARKFPNPPKSQFQEFSKREIEWIESVLKLIIRRVGQAAAGAIGSEKEVTMADLVSL